MLSAGNKHVSAEADSDGGTSFDTWASPKVARHALRKSHASEGPDGMPRDPLPTPTPRDESNSMHSLRQLLEGHNQ